MTPMALDANTIELEVNGGLTLGQAAERYWVKVASHRPNSKDAPYKLKCLVAGIGAATLLRDINGDILSRYVLKRRRTVSLRGKPLSPASVNRELGLLRSLMNRAEAVWGEQIGSIYWRGLLLTESPAPRRILSASEEQRLIAASPSHLRDPIRLSLLTGLHLGAATRLKWQQINLDIGIMRLTGFRQHEYNLPITPAIRKILEAQGVKPTGYVFMYKRARRGSRRQPIKYWHDAWQLACKRAGLAGLRGYDLRHTVGARLMTKGVDLAVVQQVMGHSYIYTTAKYLNYRMVEKEDALWRLTTPGHDADDAR